VLAAITETERKALAVPEEKRSWVPQHAKLSGSAVMDDDGWLLTKPVFSSMVEHIARNDPAAVLRRCEADRKLLARGGPFCSCYEYGPPTNPNTGQSIPHHYDCSSYETASLLAGVYGISVEEETTGE
jgi:hypothetical protein